MAPPPFLIDTKNERYVPVGYFYEDEETKLKIRFTPGDEQMSVLPALSRSRPALEMTLLYRVSAGHDVKYFATCQTWPRWNTTRR